jgi:predicted chitinase
MTVLFDTTKGTALDTVDADLTTDERLSYVKKVNFPPSDSSPYMIGASPFDEDELDVEAGDVEDVYEETLEDIEDDRDDKMDDAKKKARETGKAEDKQAVKDLEKSWFGKRMNSVKQTLSKSFDKVKAFHASAVKVASGMIGTSATFLSNVGTIIAGGPYKAHKPLTGNGKANRDLFIKAMMAEGITDPKEQAMLLAQLDHESAGFSTLEENLNYKSADKLMAISKSVRDAGVVAAQAAVAQGPEAIANLMYGGRMGNKLPGDGWLYRGRGFVQLTGKENYTAASKDLGIDLVSNPDMASSPEIASKLAIWYWKNRVGAKGASGDVTAVTKAINGGTIGLADRASLYQDYLKLATEGKLAPAAGVAPATPAPKPSAVAAAPAAPAGAAKPATPAATAAAAKATPAAPVAAVAAASAAKPAATPTVAAAPVKAAATAAGSPGLQKVSYGGSPAVDTIAAKAKEAEKLAALQMDAKRQKDVEASGKGMDGMVAVLKASFDVQMDIKKAADRTNEILDLIEKNTAAAASMGGQAPANETSAQPAPQRTASGSSPKTAVSMRHT